MTAKSTPADVKIPPRDIRFDVEGAKRRHWLGGDPVGTAVFNALSLTFPDGERMFIDAVRAFRGEVSGKLAEDVKGFIAQEAIHSREHHQLNQLIDRTHYAVDEVEAAIRERIAFSRSRGPMRMLIATIALRNARRSSRGYRRRPSTRRACRRIRRSPPADAAAVPPCPCRRS